jgi:hypothetical protein
MKVSEFKLDEIGRLSKSSFEGGKDYLGLGYTKEKIIRKLPGGSGLLYSITKKGGGYIVKLWDKSGKGEYKEPPINPERPSYYTSREWASRLEYLKQRNARRKEEFDNAPGKLIAQLTLDHAGSFPLKGAVQVGTITVDEDYRGGGLAKALYGIVLTIMKLPLVAGSSQTPGGRKNWMSLSQIPGVEMKGYFSVYPNDLEFIHPDAVNNARDRRWVDNKNAQAEKKIDIIMGQLGGQYIGGDRYHHYFAFDVQPDTTKQELKAYVDTRLNKVYSSNYDSDTGLYAVWTGR